MTITPALAAANAVSTKVQQLNALKAQLQALIASGQPAVTGNPNVNPFAASDFATAAGSDLAVFQAVVAAIP